MKAKAKSSGRVAEKKRRVAKSTAFMRNGTSSPYGFRAVELEWMKKHPEKLRPFAGQYVVVEGTRVVAHSADASTALQDAKRKGVTIPFILFLEPPLPPNTYRIGL